MGLISEESIKKTWLYDGPPLVSITCISYNHERWIAKAIESFLEQQTTFPFEIIIFDDASTDATQKIIRTYADKFPSIIKLLLQTENQWSQGINGRTTIAWPSAKGKYIAWCEGDDFWVDPFKIQKQTDFLEKNTGVSLCFTNALIEDPKNASQVQYFFRDSDLRFNYKQVLKHFWGPTCTYFFRAEHFLSNYKSWSWYNTVNSGDHFLVYIMAAYGDISYLNFTSACYRHHYKGYETQISASSWLVHDSLLKEKLIDVYSEEKRGDVRKIILRNVIEIINTCQAKKDHQTAKKIFYGLGLKRYKMLSQSSSNYRLYLKTLVKLWFPGIIKP